MGLLRTETILRHTGRIVGKVAHEFVLLVRSGLMICSFAAVQAANPGYDPSGAVMLNNSIQNQNLRRLELREE